MAGEVDEIWKSRA